TMIEGFARELPEEQMAEAILFAHKQIVAIVEMVEELREKADLGAKKLPPPPEANPALAVLKERYADALREAKLTTGKADRNAKVKELRERVAAELLPEGKESPYTPEQVSAALYALEEHVFRQIVLGGGRIDGRGPKQIRALSCEVGLLPRTHGSAVFQRGE